MLSLILHVDVPLNYIPHLCGFVECVSEYIFSFLKYDCLNIAFVIHLMLISKC